MAGLTIPEKIEKALREGKLDIEDAREAISLHDKRIRLYQEYEMGAFGIDYLDGKVRGINAQIENIIQK